MCHPGSQQACALRSVFFAFTAICAKKTAQAVLWCMCFPICDIRCFATVVVTLCWPALNQSAVRCSHAAMQRCTVLLGRLHSHERHSRLPLWRWRLLWLGRGRRCACSSRLVLLLLSLCCIFHLLYVKRRTYANQALSSRVHGLIRQEVSQLRIQSRCLPLFVATDMRSHARMLQV